MIDGLALAMRQCASCVNLPFVYGGLEYSLAIDVWSQTLMIQKGNAFFGETSLPERKYHRINRNLLFGVNTGNREEFLPWL